MALGKKRLEELVRIARRLPEREQLELIARLSAPLAKKRARRAQRVTWMEMAGVDAQIWKGIDAQEYVKRERASWHS
jgi:NCAIR mutase (PurE)-related protein